MTEDRRGYGAGVDRTEGGAEGAQVGAPLAVQVLHIVLADVAAADRVQQQLQVHPVGGHAEHADLLRVGLGPRARHRMLQLLVRLAVLGPRRRPAAPARLSMVAQEAELAQETLVMAGTV